MEQPNFATPGGVSGHEKFSSPQEELTFLREQVAQRERELAARGAGRNEQVISDKIQDYKITPAKSVFHPDYRISPDVIKSLALNLAPEAHDTKMAELLSIVKEKGIKNALSVADALNDPHIESDFHRFLVQYVKKGYEVVGLTPKSELFDELAMTLYEVSLPEATAEGKKKSLKELISVMEQFYSGMLSVKERKGHHILHWKSPTQITARNYLLCIHTQ